jgi:Tfp pilus assembly protein PilN
MTATIVVKKLTTFISNSAAALEKIGRPLWRILSFSPADDIIFPKKALCVSIDKGNLSIVFGSRLFSKINIKGARRYPLEKGRYPSPENLASSVALAINDLGAIRTEVTLSIPKAWAIIKTVEFPSTIKENLPNVLYYELDRMTPFNPEDTLYDFRILKDEGGKLTLLVMAAKANVINPYIDALRERGINVSRLMANLSGIDTLCRYIDKGADSIFVEINENGYEGALFLDSSVTDVFTGTFPSENEEQKVDTILKEILSLMDVAEKQAKSPQIMLLLRDKNTNLKELLKLNINLPLRILNDLDIKFMPSGPQKELYYAASGGVLESLWHKAKGLNLLKKGRHEIQKTPFALTAVLMLSIFVMWILYIAAPLRIEKKRLEEIDHQIMLRKEDVKRVEALKKEIDTLHGEVSTINNFKGNKPMILNLLKELTTILPQNTWLTRVRITESTVDIEGYAGSATGLLPKLEASKYFKKAEFASPTFRDARQNADRFIIKMEIEGVKVEGKKAIEGGSDEEE